MKHFDLDYFLQRIPWSGMTEAFPEGLMEKVHRLCVQKHEKLLSEHFKIAKKTKDLKYKEEILESDIKEHRYLNKNDYSQKSISDSLTESKKVKDEIYTLLNTEKDKVNAKLKETENIVYNAVQEYLKNNQDLMI